MASSRNMNPEEVLAAIFDESTHDFSDAEHCDASSIDSNSESDVYLSNSDEESSSECPLADELTEFEMTSKDGVESNGEFYSPENEYLDQRGEMRDDSSEDMAGNDDDDDDECSDRKAIGRGQGRGQGRRQVSKKGQDNQEQSSRAQGSRGRRGRGRGGSGQGRGGQGGRGRRNGRKQKEQGTKRKWKKYKSKVESNANSTVGFFETCGPSRVVQLLRQPINFFMLFVTEALIRTFVEQTNLYCRQSNGGNTPPGWQDVCYEELLAFIGIVIAMGMVKLSNVDDYWSSGIFDTPWFISIMSRKRFREISGYLHCANNEDTPPKDHCDYKLFKVKAFIDHLNTAFPQCYVPSQNLSVDEQMIGTKCRVSFIQYMPKKPKKFGLKLWALCESATGYCLRFQVYTGKIENVVEKLGYRVVFDLVTQYLNKGYRIYFDNFYTSVKLVEDLAAQKTYSCGTARSNRRELPADFTSHKLQKGQAIFWKNNNITAVTWQDKRTVHLLSSFHGNAMVEIPLRKGEQESVMKPEMIMEYNKYMNGVDRCDQFISYYNIVRKSRKWWKKIFFRLIELAIVNSMILFRNVCPEYGKKKDVHKLFRHVLIHQLVQPLLDRRANPKEQNLPAAGRQPKANTQRLKGKHFATKSPLRRRCIVCAYSKKPDGTYKGKKTKNYCHKCEKHICLECFEVYHTRSSY